jgi:hypothetical protein
MNILSNVTPTGKEIIPIYFIRLDILNERNRFGKNDLTYKIANSLMSSFPPYNTMGLE